MGGSPNHQRVAQCDKCDGWRDGGRMRRTGCEGCEPAARNIKCDLCQGKVCAEHTTRTGQPRLPPDDFIELQRAAAKQKQQRPMNSRQRSHKSVSE